MILHTIQELSIDSSIVYSFQLIATHEFIVCCAAFETSRKDKLLPRKFPGVLAFLL